MEKSWIHSGEGFEAKLVCIVYADPIATVSDFILIKNQQNFVLNVKSLLKLNMNYLKT